jgi:hypothetical protein
VSPAALDHDLREAIRREVEATLDRREVMVAAERARRSTRRLMLGIWAFCLVEWSVLVGAALERATR